MNDCGKVTFHTKRIAETASNGGTVHRRHRPAFLKAFYCKRCRGWHLSNKDG